MYSYTGTGLVVTSITLEVVAAGVDVVATREGQAVELEAVLETGIVM
jgi:hypothetical protein